MVKRSKSYFSSFAALAMVLLTTPDCRGDAQRESWSVIETLIQSMCTSKSLQVIELQQVTEGFFLDDSTSVLEKLQDRCSYLRSE